MAKKSHDPDDRPRPKPRSSRPSKDDPPPVRLRPGEEDEEDDEFDLRPKAQKGAGMPEFDDRGRKVNQRRKRLWQNISTIFTLLMVLSFFGGGLYLLLWAKKPVPPDPDMMAFVPAATTYLYGVNMKEARYNEKFRQKMDSALDRGVPPYMMSVMNQLKLRTGDLDRVIIACDSYIPIMSIPQSRGNLEQSSANGVTAVLKLRRTAWQSKDQRDRNEETVEIQFSRSDLQQVTGSEEREYNGKRYYAGRSFDGTPFYYHGASAHVLVITETERNMKELLNKPDTEIVVTGPIKKFADQLGGENFWYAMLLSGLGREYALAADSLGYGDRQIRSKNHDELGFGFAGGVYNTNVDLTTMFYTSDPFSPEATLADFEEFRASTVAPKIEALSQSDPETISLSDKFDYAGLKNASFKVSGNYFIYTNRFPTSLWEEVMETGLKFGNRIIKPPFPFFRGPFKGLEPNDPFSSIVAPPQQGGSGGATWGPGGGIFLGGP